MSSARRTHALPELEAEMTRLFEPSCWRCWTGLRLNVGEDAAELLVAAQFATSARMTPANGAVEEETR